MGSNIESRKEFDYLTIHFYLSVEFMCPSSECHVTFNNLKNLNCLRLCSAESLSPFKHLDAGPHTSVKEARRSKKETGKDERK